MKLHLPVVIFHTIQNCSLIGIAHVEGLKICPLFGKLHNIVSQMRNRHAWPL